MKRVKTPVTIRDTACAWDNLMQTHEGWWLGVEAEGQRYASDPSATQEEGLESRPALRAKAKVPSRGDVSGLR